MSGAERADGIEYDSDSGWREHHLQGGDGGRDLGGPVPLIHVHQDLL